jgi:hypothetical protein
LSDQEANTNNAGVRKEKTQCEKEISQKETEKGKIKNNIKKSSRVKNRWNKI